MARLENAEGYVLEKSTTRFSTQLGWGSDYSWTEIEPVSKRDLWFAEFEVGIRYMPGFDTTQNERRIPISERKIGRESPRQLTFSFK